VTAETQKVAKDTRDTAYRTGICIDCLTAKHAAGRTRCNPCHQRNNPSYEPLADRDNYPCHQCGQPTRPGWLTCINCFKAKGGKR